MMTRAKTDGLYFKVCKFVSLNSLYIQSLHHSGYVTLWHRASLALRNEKKGMLYLVIYVWSLIVQLNFLHTFGNRYRNKVKSVDRLISLRFDLLILNHDMILKRTSGAVQC